jgi:hypothetical protein
MTKPKRTKQPQIESDPVVDAATELMFNDIERGEILADILTDMMAEARKDWRADIEEKLDTASGGVLPDAGFAMHLKKMREIYGPEYHIKTHFNERPDDEPEVLDIPDWRKTS